jgi:hypothetical protein
VKIDRRHLCEIMRFFAKIGDYPVITFTDLHRGMRSLSHSETIAYAKFVHMVWYFRYRRRG